MMSGPPVARADEVASVETRDAMGIVTMHDSRDLNALSSQLVAGLLDAFDRFEAEEVRVCVIRANAGAKVWSAGHNIKEIPLDGDDPLGWNVAFERLLHRVRSHPVPVIGMIEGSVWGGACDLAVSCDILVGTPSTTFAITPAKLGIPYNTAGLTHFLGVLPLHIIKEMLFTANPISADEAHRFGVLNRLVSAEALEDTALGIARDIASRAPKAVRLLKAELRRLTSGPALDPDSFEEIQELRRQAYRSEDLKEGVAAFFERRPPIFRDQ